MFKLLQINVASNRGSTGRIAEDIGLVAKKEGWECYIAHGSRYVGNTALNDINIGSLCEERLHYCLSLCFDAHGRGSTYATRRFVNVINKIRPDIVHLHNIHGYYINYKILFECLKSLGVPVVWTLHDCWSFTGHCTFCDRIQCLKWKTGCHTCPQKEVYPTTIIDRAEFNYKKKKTVFTSLNNLTLVPVSDWLSGVVEDSFLASYPRIVIHNGINTSIFTPTDCHIRDVLGLKGQKVILGVADDFGERKGLDDFIQMRSQLPSDYSIVLIGVSASDMEKIPKDIIAISRTDSQLELADYYSMADVYVNPTYEDNFPTTNIEALACGTPIITYNTGGSPEALDSNTGIVVPKGDVSSLVSSVVAVCANRKVFYSSSCRSRAETLFDKSVCFRKYMELYYKLLNV